ncbi:MAG: hypothetical protein Kow00128_14850 [Deltaproteobacteria bacterium]
MRRIHATAVLLLALALPAVVSAEGWRVSPIRLELGRQAKSGVVTVTNDSGNRLQLQMKAFSWSQDAEGKDRYEETGEIIFFPKMMIFDKAEEKILRAGIKVPATKTEKTYRLYLEEIPGPRKTEGTAVAIAIRFGLPIFVAPIKEEPKGEIARIGLKKAALDVEVANSGNVHFVIRSITVQGKNGKGEEIFTRELSGWYLLAGARRTYSTEVPPEICPNLAAVDVAVDTDRFPLSGHLDADPAMCSPE